MKFATLANGTRDGQLLIVSRDLTRAVPADGIASSLIEAIERWEEVEAALQRRYDALNDTGSTMHSAQARTFDARACAAPLPRSPQWCDASAFLNHGRLMERAFNTAPIPDFDTIPVMYQGASDDFLGPHVDVPQASEADGIDFEGEFGVIVDRVPMGVSASDALGHVRLLVQLNDWSLRALGPREMRTGFGFLQAKPSTSFAPIALTPDELGADWRDGRVHLRLHVQRNDEWIGQPSGSEMNFDFGRLIAHAARTRQLSPGTIIGSGTVSNVAREAGSACLAERRGIEILAHGEARTRYLAFGERVRMVALDAAGGAPFGEIEQRIVPGC
ncbi:fumarylacetoacetate hydrolase family protein [Pandoraea nosoerga]|uniref:Fumarylacetoacetate hydrolase n=1 Tax=Pandoraea nosoerga TaxID=2508296 RepID=A0A5E4RBF7_9BURK|nr:fumarylacetoacetate hydrolase family protein [Pandoraea nosoerga]MBN4666709.1 fumarylacetoacetate hydrolase family protein [Pandoraea nosoerga]MBN4676859.1 fumarylacetoacetate hydrolase family protein [Pandoraea nosoerga]MBN4681535.1 fumarylacetoacetate hydrolase family protein [Pandoraea nosoerga]MBN4745978.1 fumarylacetoacetate hydrolase family protein [Pandoraea nosoerga]VVD60475.1 fumarylacetoacetate hydrolase [Pandoraea nosoerga]